MKLNKISIGTLLMGIILFSSCQSEYTKLVKKELSKNIHHDSLVYGLEFGQTRKDFYEICWNLNKKGIVTHGDNNNYVKAMLRPLPTDTLNKIRSIKMMFYARFNPKDKIIGMDMKFSYSAWAPWNRDFQSDKLLPVVQDTLIKWYGGNPFIYTKDSVIVKVDGNRQIQIKQESDQYVKVLIENLNYKYNHLVN